MHNHKTSNHASAVDVLTFQQRHLLNKIFKNLKIQIFIPKTMWYAVVPMKLP